VMGNVSLKIAKQKYDVKIVNQAIMKTMGLILIDENWFNKQETVKIVINIGGYNYGTWKY